MVKYIEVDMRWAPRHVRNDIQKHLRDTKFFGDVDNLHYEMYIWVYVDLKHKRVHALTSNAGLSNFTSITPDELLEALGGAI